MYSKSEPIHTVSKPGDSYRTAAFVAILVAILGLILEFRCHNLSGWILTNAVVVSTRVTREVRQGTNTQRLPSYEIYARLKYQPAGKDDHYVERKLSSNLSEYQAQHDAEALKRLGLLHVRYNPENVDDCILERSAEQTDALMPFVPRICGIAIVVAGCCIVLSTRAKKEVG